MAVCTQGLSVHLNGHKPNHKDHFSRIYTRHNRASTHRENERFLNWQICSHSLPWTKKEMTIPKIINIRKWLILIWQRIKLGGNKNDGRTPLKKINFFFFLKERRRPTASWSGPRHVFDHHKSWAFDPTTFVKTGIKIKEVSVRFERTFSPRRPLLRKGW